MPKERSTAMRCPICESQKLTSTFVETQEKENNQKMRLLSCKNCEVIFASDYELNRNEVYGENYAPWSRKNNAQETLIAEAKKTAFRCQLKELPRDVLRKKSKVLDIGTGAGYLLEVLEDMNFDPYGTEVAVYWKERVEQKFPGKIFLGDLKVANFGSDFFDLVFLTDVLEHLSNPKKTLREIDRILKPGGYLFITSPNSDSMTRKLMGKKWFQYKYEHVFYFNQKSLTYLLGKNGLSLVKFKNNRKKLSFHYYYQYFQKYSFLGMEKIFRALFFLLPSRVKNTHFSNPFTGEFLAVARKINKA